MHYANIVLYCIALYSILLYYIILYYIQLYSIVFYCIVLYYTILYYISLYSILKNSQLQKNIESKRPHASRLQRSNEHESITYFYDVIRLSLHSLSAFTRKFDQYSATTWKRRETGRKLVSMWYQFGTDRYQNQLP